MRWRDKILNKFSNNYLNAKVIFMADVCLSAFSSLLVLQLAYFVVRADFINLEFTLTYLISSIIASVLMFYIFKTYRIIIRHLSIRDIRLFALACLGKSLLTALAMFHYRGATTLWVSVSIDFLFSMFLLIGTRLAMIFLYEILVSKVQEGKEQQRVLVYGTSDKALAAVVRLQHSPHFRVMGFLVPSKNKFSSIIDGLPVESFNSKEYLQKIIKKYRLDGVLFATEKDAQKEKEGLIDFCMGNSLKCLIIPTTEEITDPQFILKPREVKVEDLLGREEIKISLKMIKEDFEGKIVLVTGAAGSIGSELCRQIAGFGVKSLVLFDNAETPMHNLRLELEDTFKDLEFFPIIGDVRSKERLDYVFRRFHPQIVFHAAAYKHVPLMEDNPCEAVLVNVIGSRNTALNCIKYNVEKMVMISTDKAVNPTNIMGCTKRLAEIFVQSLGLAVENGKVEGKTRFVTTRFGNVLGSNGSVIPRFRKQIEKGGPVTVTHPDIVRYFMTIPEACRLVMEAATMSSGNQIFIFDMGEPVKIDTLARNMISLAGLTPDKDIKIEYTGLRPGEKLYEEVLANSENTLPAFHERIRIAKVREYDYEEAGGVIEELEALSKKVDIDSTVILMKKIVPEYKSKNSRFEQFDKQ